MTSSVLSNLELCLKAITTSSCITHSVVYLVFLADSLLTNHVYTTMEILVYGDACICCRRNGCSLDNHCHLGTHFAPWWQQRCLHYLLIAGHPPFLTPPHHDSCQQIHHFEHHPSLTNDAIVIHFLRCGLAIVACKIESQEAECCTSCSCNQSAMQNSEVYVCADIS